MKKLIDALLAAGLGLLMSMPELVLAQTSTSRNHWISPGIPDQSLINHQPWPDIQLQNPSPYISIAPTGSIAGDEAEFEATGITTTPNTVVYMRPGVYQICKQETLSWNVTLLTALASGYPGSAAATPQQTQAAIMCPNGHGTWTAGQAFIATQDSDSFYGVAIYGNAGSTIGTSDPTQAPSGVGVDCFADHNALGVIMSHVTAASCVGWTINTFSDGAIPGHTIAYTQGLKVSFSNLIDSATGAINGDQANGGVNGGGFVSDMVIGPGNEIGGNGHSSTTGFPAQIYMHNEIGWRISNNTIEDGFGYGIYANVSTQDEINDNSFDKEGIFFQNGGNHITMTGNRWGIALFDPTVLALKFSAGDYQQFHMLNNDFSRFHDCATIDPSATIEQSQFDASVKPCDAWTADQLEPNLVQTAFNFSPMAGLVLTGSTFAAPDLTSSRNISIYLPHAACSGGCTVPNPSVQGLASGQQFTMTIAQDAVTGGSTINWGTAYLNPPVLASGAEESTSIQGTVLAGGAIQFGNTVNLTQPNPNLLTGGSGMTSGWTPARLLSFTNAAVTDPVGTTTGSTMIEALESVPGFQHGVQQNTTTAAGVRTISVYAKATGAGSLRYVAFNICDTLCTSNFLYEAISPSGYLAFNNESGTGRVLAYGAQPIVNGWVRYYLTYTLGSVVPTAQTIDLYNPVVGDITYVGDGVSGLNLWRPEDRAGPFQAAAVTGTNLPTVANGSLLGYAAGSGSGQAIAVPILAGTGIGVSPTAGSLTITNTGAGSSPGETFIATQTATLGVTTELDFTALSVAFASLHFVCRNIIVSATPSSLFVQVGEGGGPTWETSSNYNVQLVYGNNSTSSGTATKTGGTTRPDLSGDILDGIDGAVPAYFDLVMTKPNLSGVVKPVHMAIGARFSGDSVGMTADAYGQWDNDTNTITGLRLIDTTGTFGGTCSEYGQN